MTTAVVCGLGLVGRRVARQLVDTGTFDMVSVCDRSPKRAQSTVDILGHRSQVVSWPIGPSSLGDAAVVVSALPEDHDVEVAAHAVTAGVPAVSAADGSAPLGALQALDERARSVGVTVAAGVGFAPGLADVKPLGPAGRKCFEFCAGQEVSCRQMCPSGAYGECRQDCEADTRECLEGCPDLLRPEPPHKK